MAADEVEIVDVRKRFIESAESLEAIQSKLEAITQSEVESVASSKSLQAAAETTKEMAAKLSEVVEQISQTVGALSTTLTSSEKYFMQGESISDALKEIRSELPDILAAQERAVRAEAELESFKKAVPEKIQRKYGLIS